MTHNFVSETTTENDVMYIHMYRYIHVPTSIVADTC